MSDRYIAGYIEESTVQDYLNDMNKDGYTLVHLEEPIVVSTTRKDPRKDRFIIIERTEGEKNG